MLPNYLSQSDKSYLGANPSLKSSFTGFYSNNYYKLIIFEYNKFILSLISCIL